MYWAGGTASYIGMQRIVGSLARWFGSLMDGEVSRRAGTGSVRRSSSTFSSTTCTTGKAGS